MAWAEPEFDRVVINGAGRRLLKGYETNVLEYFEALGAINNWRASHAFPLNTFQMNLRRKGKSLDDECLIAQRIKRLSSIQHKLERFPKMKLTQMQDIGGCRAIMSSVHLATELVKSYKTSAVKHKLASEDDYISNPKPSGYRGVHLVYRYFLTAKTPITI